MQVASEMVNKKVHIITIIFFSLRAQKEEESDIVVTRQINNVINMLEINNQEKDARVETAMNLINYLFYKNGSYIERNEELTFNAVNQFTKIPTTVRVKMWEKENQSIQKGDILIFASVGAGMNINAFVYRY